MAPWGAIIRIAVQVGMATFNAVLKALPEAYAAGRRGGGTVSSAFTKKRIKVAEARQILGFEEASEVSGLTKEDVMEAYGKLFDLNDPSDGGSLYLQAKVYHAKESLLEELGVPPEERELPEHGDGDSDDDDTDEKKAQEQVQAEADERR